MNNNIEQITEKVKNNFGFKCAEAYQSKTKGYFELHFTYDYAIWKVISFSFDCTESDIINRIQDVLIKSDYDGGFVLNPHTLSICTLIAQYGLDEVGYFTSMNTVYWQNPKTNVVHEIVDTESIRHFTIGLDKENDFKSLSIMTNEHYYCLTHDGFEIRPAWGK